MKSLRQTLSFLFVIMIATSSLAQMSEEGSSSSSFLKRESYRPWYISVDVTPILLSGFGFTVGRQVTSNITTEIFASTMTLKEFDYDSSILSTKHNVKQFGVRSDYMFNGVSSSGLYVGAALGYVEAKSTGRMQILTKAPVENSVTSSTTLMQGFAGYQAIGRSFASSALAFRFGLGYGTGNRFAVNYGGTRNEIQSGPMIEIRGGMMF